MVVVFGVYKLSYRKEPLGPIDSVGVVGHIYNLMKKRIVGIIRQPRRRLFLSSSFNASVPRAVDVMRMRSP